MQRLQFPWRIVDSTPGSVSIRNAGNRMVMNLLVDDHATAERIVRVMNDDAEELKAKGHKQWLSPKMR